VYELAINEKVLDMPEVLWKAYIDFEIKLGEQDRTRQLYARLLERTKHVKVWISYAQFEATAKEAVKAREVFVKADAYFKEAGLKEERLMLLEGWRDFEKNFGTPELVKDVTSKLPKRIRKKRQVLADDGTLLHPTSLHPAPLTCSAHTNDGCRCSLCSFCPRLHSVPLLIPLLSALHLCSLPSPLRFQRRLGGVL
jgi:hypothetical protein